MSSSSDRIASLEEVFETRAFLHVREVLEIRGEATVPRLGAQGEEAQMDLRMRENSLPTGVSELPSPLTEFESSPSALSRRSKDSTSFDLLHCGVWGENGSFASLSNLGERQRSVVLLVQ